MTQTMTPSPAQTPTIAMVGGGQMALALAAGFCRAGLVAPATIVVFDPVAAARDRLAHHVPGVRFADSGAAAVAGADLIFLAVKPQQAQAACTEIATGVAAEGVVVSIVAGLPLATLATWLGTRRVIRVMPNTPCLVGKGVSAVCRTPEVPAAAASRVSALLAAVGYVHEVDEGLLDAVTALAQALAVETLAGTAALLEQTGDHPAQIKDRVSSPGGTTIAGLAVLEQQAVRGALIDAVVAAAARAKELGLPAQG